MKDTIKLLLKKMIPVELRPRIRAIYWKIYYFGFKYKCTFCYAHLRAFQPFGLKFPVLEEKKVIGGGHRLSVSCPVCGSLDRERLLYLYLLHKTGVFGTPLKLLHVAPEARLGEILKIKTNIDYLTSDISGKNVMVKMDITDIRFPDETFDAIICNHVLEHIIDDHKAMSELYRTLKRGGWAILQVPISLTLNNTFEDCTILTETCREEAFGQNDHVRIYAKDYKDRLKQVGFKVSVFNWISEIENFGGRENLFGLNEEEGVYFVTKPVRGDFVSRLKDKLVEINKDSLNDGRRENK